MDLVFNSPSDGHWFTVRALSLRMNAVTLPVRLRGFAGSPTGVLRLLVFTILLGYSTASAAVLDLDSNGLDDLWEMLHSPTKLVANAVPLDPDPPSRSHELMRFLLPPPIRNTGLRAPISR